MANAGATSVGPTANITAPSGSIVTSWALRNFVENVAGYGWTWESGTSSGQPSVVAEIRSSDGAMRIAGNFTMSGDNYTRYGPNSSWSAYLRVGGNGRVSTTDATVATTNGNLHLDSANGSNIYLNYYAGGIVYGPSGVTMLHSGNYTSYSPSLTGSGASGSWGINITGNSATVGGFTPSQSAGAASRVVVADGNGYTPILFTIV
jgi:hypothetical protein